MATTIEELKELLKKEPEIDLLEILNIDSEMLVERFIDEIEERFQQLEEEYGNLSEEQEDSYS